MAQATRFTSGAGAVVLVLSEEEAKSLKYALAYSANNTSLHSISTALFGALPKSKPTFRVVTPKPAKFHSRVRMLKDCGRWVTPGEVGVISSIDFDHVTPEDTQYTVVFEPGRYQVMARECFEVL